MKLKSYYTVISLVFATGISCLHADPGNTTQPTEKAKAPENIHRIGPRHVRVQVEYIEMPLVIHSALLDDEKATASDSILRDHVAKLIKSGKAHILESQLLVARSGEKATSESIREFIYPTEYEPPEIPTTVHTTPDGTKSTSHDKDLATGPTPTAFETRNLGSTLEVEPTIGDNSKYIDLRVGPEIVSHTKNTIYATWKDKHGTANIVMPEIYVLRVTTAITVKNGKPALLGVLSPKNENGHVDYTRKVMVFVRADIINIK